jgi:predicted DCC family thiol-disulfide oxidoreductase YuxK
MWTPLKTVFGIDLRTLALLRIMLGVAILCDVINRWPYAAALYSDDGVWPRQAAMAFNAASRWSLLYVSGGAWLVHALFVGLVLAALALIYGYRTRVATGIAWVLFVSLTNRNLIIQQGGDILLCLLLFWSLFLPLGARFSIDDAMRSEHAKVDVQTQPRSHGYFSAATAALLLQASYVYVFGALLKTGPAWTQDHSAIYYALSLESIARPAGEWFAVHFKGLLSALTAYVYWLELLMPLYMFTPLFFLVFRGIGLFLLILLHLGFAVLLNVGLFPLISIVSLCAFLPGSAWDAMARRWHAAQGPGWTLFYDEGCSFCRKTCLLLRSFCLPYETRIAPAQSDPVAGPILERETSWVVRTPSGEQQTKWAALLLVLNASPLLRIKAWLARLVPQSLGNRLYAAIGDNREGLGRMTSKLLPYRTLHEGLGSLATALVIAFAAVVFLWNVSQSPGSGLVLPQSINSGVKAIRVWQRWDMFAPMPATLEGHYVLEGRLADGSLVDLWTKKPGLVSTQPPEDLRAWFEDYRWRKLFERVHQKRYVLARTKLADYWCRQIWQNAQREEQKLAHVKMTYYARYTQPNGRPDRQKTFKLFNRACPRP